MRVIFYCPPPFQTGRGWSWTSDPSTSTSYVHSTVCATMLCVCAVENGTQGSMHARSALHQQSYVPSLNLCYFESEGRSFLAIPAIWFFPYFHSRCGEDVAVQFWYPILALWEIAFERLLNFLRTGETAYLEKKVMNGRRERPTTSLLLCFVSWL